MVQEKESAASRYDRLKGRFDRLLGEVEFEVNSSLETLDVHIHTSSGRVKSRASFLDKVDRKQYSEVDNQMPDAVGWRIVCLFLDDLPKIGKAIEKIFYIRERVDTVNGKDPEHFGYMSRHYVCMLNNQNVGLRYDDLKGILFEIQVRTVAMDAWANISHFLAYKGAESVPAQLRRDFSALSGLFYVADRQFQQFYSQSIDSQDSSLALQSQGTAAAAGEADIDRDSVSGLLSRLYPDREQASAVEVSELVQEVRGYTHFRKISELESVLVSHGADAIQSEFSSPPTDVVTGEPTRFSTLGIARETLGLAIPEFAEGRRKMWSVLWSDMEDEIGMVE